MTLLGPLLISALGILPAYFASLPAEERSVMVLDPANLLGGSKGTEQIQLKYLGPPEDYTCLLYTSPSPRDRTRSRMPSSA